MMTRTIDGTLHAAEIEEGTADTWHWVCSCGDHGIWQASWGLAARSRRAHLGLPYADDAHFAALERQRHEGSPQP